MTKQVQLRRGTTVQHSTFTGALAELTVDTDTISLVLHDGAHTRRYSTRKARLRC